MAESHTKLAKLLRTDEETVFSLDQKMIELTGRADVIDEVIKENESLVNQTLAALNISREGGAETVYTKLTARLEELDRQLYELLERPDLSRLSSGCGKICETALSIYTPPKGLFIKKNRVVELLEKYPPDNMLAHFGYGSVKDLIEKEGFAAVVSGLRFTQSTEWMHKFFDESYGGLAAGDFEERDVEIIVLDSKWLDIAVKFQKKKYHNISHLKEYGIIFIIPDPIDKPGETMRMFTLILHYLHEVPFYSGLFRRFSSDADFVSKLQSLLRGDVLSLGDSRFKIQNSRATWLIIQRYLAKDDENDPRLAMPHVNPEAEHWHLVAQDLAKLSQLLPGDGDVALDNWATLDFAGDFFKNGQGNDQLVNFDLIDLTMSLVTKGEVKYLYHQQEALWNRILIGYMGREKMNQLIEDNIIKGYIEL